MAAVFLSAEAIRAVAVWISQIQGPGFHWSEKVWLEAALENAHGRVFGEDGPSPRAVILFQDLGEVVEILALATHPELRRSGAMKVLLLEFISHFSGIKSEVWLEVHSENQAARDLYEKLGFKKVGERPHYYGPGQTAIVMTKALPSP